MKKLLLFVFLLMYLAIFTMSQVPQSFQYQVVVRDGGGNVLINQLVNFRISIISGILPGTIEYVETHTESTNAFGIVTLAIGEGIPITNLFSEIDWSTSPYSIKIETDPTGGTNYIDMGTTQLLSVPYALYAKAVIDDFFDPKYPDGINGETVMITGTYSVPTGKNLIITNATNPNFSGYTMAPRIVCDVDTLWGDWHYIPENSTINVLSPIIYNSGLTGLLFDRKTEYIKISTQTNYIVPMGKKLYLFLPRLKDFSVMFNIPGYFRINGNNNITSYYEIQEPQLLILPAGYTIEYVDNTSGSYNLPPRVFTGYLK